MRNQYSILVIGFTVFASIFLVAQSSSVLASEISYTFTGDYTSLESGADAAGLVGASFVYTSTFDREPSNCTVGVGFTNCVYLSGTGSLSLMGTAGGVHDGVHSPSSFTAQSIWQEPGLTFFTGTSFEVGSFELDVMNLVPIHPSLFSGVGSLLPELTTSDVLSGDAFAGTNHFANVYKIENITVTTTVPAPATMALLLLGLLGIRGKLQLR